MNYFKTGEKKDCNGCGICALRCPKDAIQMIEDLDGFYYPKIDKSKCINCKVCEKICPNKSYEKTTNSIAFVSYNKDNEIKLNSASGGMFYGIANYVINCNGVVFGVKYDKELNVIHSYTTTLEGLKEFQGSKYARSNIGDSYSKVKDFLNKNRLVLFTGTPCQCQALKTFLGKDYINLITCEIICHANPSPKVLKLYKRNLELKYHKNVVNISFRSKKTGWKRTIPLISFEDGTEIEEDSFYRAFVNELINRESCHNCFFCSANRLSDFTIGDFWGFNKIESSIEDDDTGLSLLCINTLKAEKLFDKIKENIVYEKVNIEKAFSNNHHNNVDANKKRNIFFKKIEDGTINENNIIKYMRKYTKRSISIRVFNKIKSIILLKIDKNRTKE